MCHWWEDVLLAHRFIRRCCARPYAVEWLDSSGRMQQWEFQSEEWAQMTSEHIPSTFVISMRAGKVASRTSVRSMDLNMAQHRLDDTQNTGSTPGMNLKEAMINSDYDLNLV